MDDDVPSLLTSPTAHRLDVKRIGIAAALGALICVVVAVVRDPPISAEARAIAASKQVLSEYLQAPSTVKYLSEKVVASNSLGLFVVLFVLDAQNAFGVPLRHTLCVAVHLHENKTFTYNKVRGVAECENPPSQEEVDLLTEAVVRQ